MAATHADNPASQTSGWAWHPRLPFERVPVFVWPPRPLAAVEFVLSLSFLSAVLPYIGLALATWMFLQPALERCVEFRFDWIAEIVVRNLTLLVVIAGGLHLYLFTFRCQGLVRKFDARTMHVNNAKFFARDQVRDNMLWSCASGVIVWSAYEVLFLWAYANDHLPVLLDWQSNPVGFVAWFVAIPFWTSLHFYFVHRLLHWRPLYKMVHSVHHRNDHCGPWSGLAMHPLEHLLFYSGVLVHLIIASHPLHLLFHMQWYTLGTAVSHAGFDSITVKGRPVLYLMPFHHALHHRHYNCNYGNLLVPCDRWFGTDHDGTPESWHELTSKRRARF